VSQKPGFILLETNYRLFAYTGEAFPCQYHGIQLQTPLMAS